MSLNLCRICLSSDATTLNNLFSTHRDIHIVDDITFCSGIVISANDHLPHYICEDCLRDVSAACIIKKKCIESDQLLRKQLDDGNENEVKMKEIETSQVSDCFEGNSSENNMEQRRMKFRKRVKPQFSRPTKPSGLTKPHRELRKPSVSDFRCFICDAQFDLIKSKKEHIMNDHSSTDRCRICDRVCQTSLATERHIKTHFIQDNIFLCPVCAATFYKKYSLDRHLLQVHGNSAPQFFCDMCHDWKTKFRTNLKRHMKSVHLQIKQHRCPHTESCPDKFFTTKDTLNFHLVGHHNLVLIKCTSCSQKFDTEQDLDEHKASGRCVQRTVRKRLRGFKPGNLDETGFSCHICQKSFNNKTQSSVHYHQKHKSSLICKICCKEFTQYANLLRHIKTIHEQQKRFSCSVCSKSFSQKHSLDNHLNIHTGNKPFSCNSCPFKTGDRSSLAKHKKKC